MTDKTYYDVQAEINALVSDLHAAFDDICSRKELLIKELMQLIFKKKIEAQTEYEEDVREKAANINFEPPQNNIAECLTTILKEYYEWVISNHKPEKKIQLPHGKNDNLLYINSCKPV